MMPSKTSHPVFYRVYQFFAALKASLPIWAGGVKGGLTPADKALVASILPMPSQQQLFSRMPPNDQRHALAVARTLQQAGHTQPALLQAALLHDVGKSMGQPIIHRVVIVLLEAFWPGALRWLSNGERKQASGNKETEPKRGLVDGVSWGRRPFVIHAHHPLIGAEWAKEAACEPLTVELIARHETALAIEPINMKEKLLVALQWADDLN